MKNILNFLMLSILVAIGILLLLNHPGVAIKLANYFFVLAVGFVIYEKTTV